MRIIYLGAITGLFIKAGIPAAAIIIMTVLLEFKGK